MEECEGVLCSIQGRILAPLTECEVWQWGDAAETSELNMPPPLVILAGLPGSGKSTFARHLETSLHGFYCVCQDRLGSLKRVLEMAEIRLLQGRPVVIDRTNLTAQRVGQQMGRP